MSWLGWCGDVCLIASVACTRRREAPPETAEPEMTMDELNKSTLAVSTLRSRPQSAPPGSLPTEKQTEGARAVELFEQMRAVVLKKSVDASGETAKEGNQATQMQLQFAIVEKGERLFEGTVTLAASRQEQSYRAATGDTSRVYLVTYSFGRPHRCPPVVRLGVVRCWQRRCDTAVEVHPASLSTRGQCPAVSRPLRRPLRFLLRSSASAGSRRSGRPCER